MPSARALATLCLLPLALATRGSQCLGPNADGSNLCFTWAVDPSSATITVNAQCTPPAAGPTAGKVTWCALGLAKPPNTKTMFPANVWVFGVLPAGSAFIGDHYSLAYAQPPCLPTQSSKALSSATVAGSNALNVTFSRASPPHNTVAARLTHTALISRQAPPPPPASQTGPLTVPLPGVSIASGVPISIIGALSTQALPGDAPFCSTKPNGVFPIHVGSFAPGTAVTFY